MLAKSCLYLKITSVTFNYRPSINIEYPFHRYLSIDMYPFNSIRHSSEDHRHSATQIIHNVSPHVHIAKSHKYFCYVKFNGIYLYINYGMNTAKYSVPITNMIKWTQCTRFTDPIVMFNVRAIWQNQYLVYWISGLQLLVQCIYIWYII